MSTRLIGICFIFSLFSCLSSPALVDPQKSQFFFRQGRKYFFVAADNKLPSGTTQLKQVSGELVILAPMIAADLDKIYYKKNAQTVADRGSFVADDPLYRDKNHVYRLGNFTLDIVPAADPSTFRYLQPDSSGSDIWAVDKQRYFLRHKPVVTDFSTFCILNNHLAFDSLHIYLATEAGLRTVAKTDGKVERITPDFCHDKSSVYYYSKKTGFSKTPLAPGSRISVIRNEEISVNKRVLNVLH